MITELRLRSLLVIPLLVQPPISIVYKFQIKLEDHIYIL